MRVTADEPTPRGPMAQITPLYARILDPGTPRGHTDSIINAELTIESRGTIIVVWIFYYACPNCN